jgi:glutathione S-transferase
MKLYYMPATCALAPHIAAREAGLEFELVEVKRSARGLIFGNGQDYAAINRKGKVPALEVDGGIITETQAILQYIAAQAPDRLPFPTDGMPRWHMLETLNFITTELHRGFSPLGSPNVAPAHKAEIIEAIGRAFTTLEVLIGDRAFLGGEHFTVADAYTFVATGWASLFDIDLAPWPVLQAYRARIAARPGVQQAQREEGLAADTI